MLKNAAISPLFASDLSRVSVCQRYHAPDDGVYVMYFEQIERFSAVFPFSREGWGAITVSDK
jgi:hypothetical protein